MVASIVLLTAAAKFIRCASLVLRCTPGDWAPILPLVVQTSSDDNEEGSKEKRESDLEVEQGDRSEERDDDAQASSKAFEDVV